MKRKLAFFAAITMICTPADGSLLCSFSQSMEVAAEYNVVDSGECGAQLRWWLTSDGKLTISGNDFMTSAPWKKLYGSSNPDGIYITSVKIDKDVKSICSEAFSDCHYLTNVSMNNSVLNTIEESAFKNCYSLQSIDIPSSVSDIGSNAFYGCSELSSIKLPEGITTIHTGTFLGCTSLDECKIPESVTKIEKNAFWGAGCVIKNSDIQYVDNWAVGIGDYWDIDTSISKCDIRYGTKGICQELLSDHRELTLLSLPSSLEYINEQAFAGTSIKSLELPSNLHEVGRKAFMFCIELVDLSIPMGVESIESEAFSNCNRIESLVLPSSLSSLGSSAFYDCTSLKEITVYSKDCSTGYSTFGFSSSPYPERVFKAYINTPFSSEAISQSNCTFVPFDESHSDWEYESGILTVKKNRDEDHFSWLELAKYTTSIIIQDSVTVIPENAFSNFNIIESVELPSSVSEVGAHAFYNCSNLKKIWIFNPFCTISDSSGTIPQGTIYSYLNSPVQRYVEKQNNSYKKELLFDGVLGEADINNKINYILDADGVLNIRGTGELVFYTSNNKEYSPFSGNQKIQEVIIEDGITSIDSDTFSGCSNLTSITIPESVTRIGYGAFRNCDSLTDIILPDALTSISDSAFYGCTKLKEVSLPDTLISIGEYAFANCESLEEIKSTNCHAKVGSYAFSRCTGLKTLPDLGYSRKIEPYTFYNCTGLTEIATNSSIDKYAFAGCTELTSIILYGESPSIGIGAFENCENLSKVELKTHSSTIETDAFLNCYNLKSISLPSIKSISEHALGYNGQYYHGEMYYTRNSEFIINAPYNTEGWDYAYNNNFLPCKCGDNVEYSLDSEGILTVSGSGEMYDYMYSNNDEFKYEYKYLSPFIDKKIVKVIIEEGVTSVGRGVWNSHKELSEIIFPDSLEYIGDYAFHSTGITEIEIPPNVKSIGNMAFSLTGITEIEIPQNVKSIGEAAFGLCEKLKKIVLHDGLTYIDSCAFESCYELTDIELPDSVHYIGEGAFWGCYNLKSITIPCNTISIMQNAFKSTDLIIYCNAGSDAAKYARENKISYQYIESEIETTATTTTSTTTSTTKATTSTSTTSVTTTETTTTTTTSTTTTATTTETTTTTIPIISYGQCGDNVTWTLNQNGTLVISGFGQMYNYDDPLASDSETELPNSLDFYNSYYDYQYNTRTPVVSPFDGNENVIDIIIEEGVTSIGNYAFLNCMNLQSIRIPESMLTIGSGAIKNCSSLEKIQIPDNVLWIEANAFENVSRSFSILGYMRTFAQIFAEIYDIPFVSLGEVPGNDPKERTPYFKYFDNLELLYIGGNGSVKDCGSYQNYYSTVKTVVIENGITDIPDGAFNYFIRLESIRIPDTVTSIGEQAFQNCNMLKSVIIPDSVTELGSHAFYGCKSLNSITLSNQITKIEHETFRLSGLISVVIPDSVEEVDAYAFQECDQLVSVDLGNGLKMIHKGAFNRTGLTTVSIPNQVEIIDEDAFSCNIDLEEVVIGSGVTYIDSRVFYDCWHLKKLMIIGTIDSFGNLAFENSPLFSLKPTLSSICIKTDGDTGDLCFTPLTKIEVHKQDEYGNEISGGLFELTGSDTNDCRIMFSPCQVLLGANAELENYDHFSLAWQSDTEPTVLIVEDGYYMLYEGALPENNGDNHIAFVVKQGSIEGSHDDDNNGIPDVIFKIPSANAETTTTLVVTTTTTEGTTTTTTESTTATTTGTTTTTTTETTPTTTTSENSTITTTSETSTTTTTSETSTTTTDTTTPTTTAVSGDVNGDDSVTAGDAQIVLQEYVNILSGNPSTFTHEQFTAADVNKDGEISVDDAQYILLYYVNTLTNTLVTWEELIQN